MQGLELVKDLADLEHEFAKRLDEARRSAEQKIAEAEEEARRIGVEADAQIRLMAETWKAEIAEASRKQTEDALARAETEARRIHEQAGRNMDRAVDFILSQVLP